MRFLSLFLLLAWIPGLQAQQAQLKTGLPESLKFAPIDASFYYSITNAGWQWDQFVESKAVKQFLGTKYGQALVEYFKEGLIEDLKQAEDVDDGLVSFIDFIQSNEGRSLFEFGLRLSEQEIFVLSDGTFARMLKKDLDARREKIRVLQNDANAIEEMPSFSSSFTEVPYLVAGGKISSDADRVFVSKMLDDLEQIFRTQIQQADSLSDIEKDHLLSQLSRLNESDSSDHLVMHLVGSEYPWDAMRERIEPDRLESFEQRKAIGESLEAIFSIGLTDDYLVACISPDRQHLEDLNDPSPLYKKAAFAPVIKARSKALTNIGFQSSDFKQANSWLTILEPVIQVSLSSLQNDLSRKLGDTEDAKRFLSDVQNDTNEFMEDLQSIYNPPGDMLSFGFVFGEGVASLTYDYRVDSIRAKNQTLDVLRHVGDQPAYFSASGEGEQRDSIYSKWASRVWQRSEEMDALMGNVAPPFVFGPLEELYRITVDEFLPSMGDESAFVIDLSQKQDSWHPLLGGFTFPAPALVFEVEDAVAYRSSWRSYYETINELAAPFRPMLPLPPGQDLPVAVESDMQDGIYLQVPMIEMLGANEAFRPGMALNEGWSVFSLFPSQAEALLSESEPNLPIPLSNLNRPLMTASHFDQAQICDLILNYLIDSKPMILERIPGMVAEGIEAGTRRNTLTEALDEMTPEELFDSMKAAVEMFRCMNSHTAATYVEGNAIVTQKAIVLKDLP